MVALFFAAYEDQVSTGTDDGVRVFVVSAHLRPDRAAAPEAWLVEARAELPYPDQRCAVAWDHAAALGIDAAPHMATDAAGERFRPGTSFRAVIGAGAPDPEPAALALMAPVGAALRAWLAALRAAGAVAPAPDRPVDWPPPPDGFAGVAWRFSPENVLALADRPPVPPRQDPAVQGVSLREQNADPIYMPHNIG